MKKIRILSGLLLALCLAAPVAAQAEGIVISGSTTVLPIMQKVVEAYLKVHPGLEISLSASGSGDGIKAIIDGSLPRGIGLIRLTDLPTTRPSIARLF